MAADKRSSSLKEKIAASGEISFDPPAQGILLARLSGRWKTGARLPASNEVTAQIEQSKGIVRIGFETDGITDWDSSLLTLLVGFTKLCDQNKIRIKNEGLPRGLQRLVAMATAEVREPTVPSDA